jgi:Flp pilus assembly protein TadG
VSQLILWVVSPESEVNMRPREEERGAALVELAVTAPLLLLLVFGIIEAGWLFAQQVEARHGAREAARVAAVSAPDLNGDSVFTEADVIFRACDALDLSSGSAGVTISAAGDDIGDNAAVTITTVYQSLTGFLDPIFGGLVVTTDADIRLEQPRAWADAGPVGCP